MAQQKQIWPVPWGHRINPWPPLQVKDPALLWAVVCVGRRCGLDPMLLWLWCRPSSCTLIWPLAWELPYTTGTALKRLKKKKNPPAVAQVTAEVQVQSLAQECPYAAGVAIRKKKKKLTLDCAVPLQLHHCGLSCVLFIPNLRLSFKFPH